MNIKVKEIENKLEKESVSREVLYDLQEWFGMPESTEEYIQDSQEKPFLACYINDKLVGFIVLNATSKDCAEIFVMGIKRNSIEWELARYLTKHTKLWQGRWVTHTHR
ncbi:GNAT family acetyltransferase [Gardnerella vaginalis]|uniref:Acetyltransferase, GNAT family n=1 Tax=Gardnerella vaginalis (strain ATCC 14019 / 317) TaxID=525284 RepID=E3DAQ7_GARV3|nr:GNAT family acetyltransferase [Gardnerella vaginalis]ADP39151.1 acetyltransferase, GNAT family [Gardnerella vaginalis ATCC 14019]